MDTQLSQVGPQRSIVRASIALAFTAIVGTVGYKVLAPPDYTWIDALYMTAVTLTTVGYNEVIPIGHDPALQIFTICLLMLGVGCFIYFFSNLTAFVVDAKNDQSNSQSFHCLRRRKNRQLRPKRTPADQTPFRVD